MKESVERIVIALGFLFIVVGVSTFVSTAVTSFNEEAQNKSNYFAKHKGEFMNACDPSGGQTNYCECALNVMEEKYSIVEVVKMSQEYSQTNQLTDEMYAIAELCYHEL